MRWDRQSLSPVCFRLQHRPELLRTFNGGTNFISRRSAADSATTNTGVISTGSSGSSLRRSGASTTRRSSAASFDNPDHVQLVVHNYRWRLGLAEGETKYDDLEKRLAKGPIITVPS